MRACASVWTERTSTLGGGGEGSGTFTETVTGSAGDPSSPGTSRLKRGQKKRWPPGEGQRAKVRPPIGRQMHASSHVGGGVWCWPAPPRGAKEGWVWLVFSWRGMRSRPAGLLARANPRRGRASETRSLEKTTAPETDTPADWRPRTAVGAGQTRRGGGGRWRGNKVKVTKG